MNILAIDVCYDEDNHTARAAGVIFHSWDDASPSRTLTTNITNIAEYVPGEFYKRELPCILALLNEHLITPDLIIVDGYVYLDDQGTPGLGCHLFDELLPSVPVVGVAKTKFHSISAESAVLRGNSTRPLYVTSRGISLEEAKTHILAMHGKNRIPTLLTAVDHACRGWAA